MTDMSRALRDAEIVNLRRGIRQAIHLGNVYKAEGHAEDHRIADCVTEILRLRSCLESIHKHTVYVASCKR